MTTLTKAHKIKRFVITSAFLLIVYSLSYLFWRKDNISITTESVGTTAQDDMTTFAISSSKIRTLYYPAIFLEVITNKEIDTVTY